MRTTREITAFEDGWLGQQQRHMDTEVGDFTIRRSDGIPAYQLACAVDEAAQRITEVVRGADLLGSTFRQLYLSHKLHLDIPGYRHLPVLVDLEHRKLSKQNHAKPVAAAKATDTLLRCLKYLGQPAPMEFHDAKPGEILDWALVHWQAQKVPRALEMTVVD